MEKPEYDIAYEIFTLVGDGPFPSQCDDLMDEQEFIEEAVEEGPLLQVQAPFGRRRQDHRWR